MDKQIMLYSYNRILLSNKKEQISAKHNTLDESQMHYAKWKKPDSIGYLLYDSMYTTVWKEQKKKNTYKWQRNQWLPGAMFGEERRTTKEYWRDVDIGVLELIYILIVVMVRQLYTLAKTPRTIR